MTDYISREDLLHMMQVTLDRLPQDVFNPNKIGFIAAMEGIKNFHAADVREAKRGKWIKYAPHNSDMMTCSECEKYWILDGDQYDFNFCPNCGADMRGGK